MSYSHLARATIRSDQKSSTSLHPTSRDGVHFERYFRVIHLQQIRFDRSASLVVIHASRNSETERSKRPIRSVTNGLWLLVVGICPRNRPIEMKCLQSVKSLMWRESCFIGILSLVLLSFGTRFSRSPALSPNFGRESNRNES
jgi:hypothetical protein